MNRSPKIIISVIVSIGLCFFVWQFLNLDALLKVLRSISFKWLLITLIVFLLYQWFRTLRFELLIDMKNSRYRLFNTLCLHALLNHTLPVGLGEAALVYLLKKNYTDVTIHSGTASLLFARLIDLILFIILFFGIGLLFSKSLPSEFNLIMYILLVVISIGILLLWFLVSRYRDHSPPENRKDLRGLLVKHILFFLNSVHDIFKRKNWFSIVLYSLCMWLMMYLFFLSTILSLGFEMSWYVVLILYLLMFPLSLLPIRGIGSFGTHEAAWFFILQFLGIEAFDSALLGFGSHIVFLIIIILVALIPLTNYLLSSSTQQKSTAV